jgi:DNA-binding CsgD family transcriptional regulator/PAS domain-containing protein
MTPRAATRPGDEPRQPDPPDQLLALRTGGGLVAVPRDESGLLGLRHAVDTQRSELELCVPSWILERQEELLRAHGGPPAEQPLGITVSPPASPGDATRVRLGLAAPSAFEDELLRQAEIVAATGSWLLEVDSGELRWSPNLLRIFGLAPGAREPHLGELAAFVHPADRERFVGRIAEMQEDGVLGLLRYRILVDGRVRHVRATLAVVDRDPAGRPLRLLGAVHDVTELRRAEQEIAAHVAVSEALDAWDGLEPGGDRLLAAMADALDASGGVLWAPEDEHLVARVVWRDPSVDLEPFWAATRDMRLRRGVGVAGTAWARAEPVLDVDGTLMRRGPRRAAAVQSGVGADLAIPALLGDEVVAVVELPLREVGHSTERLMRSLVGLGHELGQFLGRRRGQIGAARLTARELEVLQLAARGLTTQATATELVISPATVKTHLAHVYEKLAVTDRAAAVATAMRLGLIA